VVKFLNYAGVIMTFLSVPISATGEAPLVSLTPATTQYREIEERLPFTIRLVHNESDLHKAVQIRQSAYARHMPAVAQGMTRPETADTQDDVVVLLAESKLDGSPLGTVRLQTNTRQPLGLEQAIELPHWLQGKRLAHVSRLGVEQGHTGRLVRLMLFKGLFMYWKLNRIDWGVVAAREPLDRMYQQLLFQDVFPGAGLTPLPHMGNVPHRIMAFDVNTAFERWKQASHPLTQFIFYTYHPDLDVGELKPAQYLHPGVASKQELETSVAIDLG
jgi:hypothetical protein